MKRRARKSKVSKKASRKSASQKKAAAKRARKKTAKPSARARTRSAPAAPSVDSLSAYASADFTASATDPKTIAVVQCVNATMDESRPHWNDDMRGDTRKMDTDYRYDTNSMPAFLGLVQHYLRGQRYALTITEALVRACVPAMLFQLKFLVAQQTRRM